MNPKVSIIILNWNGWSDTIECLESLYRITYPNYVVIVVDNGSEDESIEKIKEYCEGKIEVESKFFKYSPENKPIKNIECMREEAEAGSGKEKEIENVPSNKKIIIIKNEKNYGFAGGANIGMRYALKALNPDYILLLNNDTVVDKEFLSELVKVAGGDEKIGIVGAVNYYYDEPKRIWYSGGIMNWAVCKLRDITRNKIDNGQFEKIREVDEVAGSSLLIKAEVIDKIGLFYSDYFCYFEETDWCIKAKKKGYLLYANLNSKIWHKVASSSKKVSGFEIYYLTRNRFVFMRRNATKLQFIYFLIYFFLKNSILMTAFLIVLRKDLKLLKTFYKAIYDGIMLSLKRDAHDNDKILEKQIKKRFDQISDKSWFSEDIEMDNFQLLELYDFFGDIENKKILDIGCAKGRFVKRLVEKGAIVTGIDLSEQLINEARKNVPHAQFIMGSATNLPFKDEEFDCVYCIETFEHIPNTKKGISEACRVLKTGGKITVIDKHILGLNPNFLVPNFIRKPLLEKCNGWMYPKDFPFKEKYFVKKDLNKYLALYCREKYTEYLPGFRVGHKTWELAERYPNLVKIRILTTNFIYKVVPFTSHCIAWKWIK